MHMSIAAPTPPVRRSPLRPHRPKLGKPRPDRPLFEREFVRPCLPHCQPAGPLVIQLRYPSRPFLTPCPPLFYALFTLFYRVSGMKRVRVAMLAVAAVTAVSLVCAMTPDIASLAVALGQMYGCLERVCRRRVPRRRVFRTPGVTTWWENFDATATDAHFAQMLRFKRKDFDDLVEELHDEWVQPQLQNRKLRGTKRKRRRARVDKRRRGHERRDLAVYLMHVAQNTSMNMLDELFVLGGHADRIVGHMETVIETVLLKKEVTWMKPHERKQASKALVARFGPVYKGCVGFLDGCDFIIRRPSIDQRAWYSGYHKFHAMKAQFIVDAWGFLRWYHVGVPGRIHDSTHFEATSFAKHPAWYLSPGEWILADSAYASKSWLAKPYTKPQVC